MAKISIQQSPVFEAEVQVPRIGGKPVAVKFQFRFLDRAQIADFIDAELQHGKDAAEAITQPGTKLSDLTAKSEEFQLEQLKKIVAGWGFDDEFSDENLAALVRSTASVPDAIINAYKNSYQGAREGN